MHPDLSVVIPTFNEADRIGASVQAVVTHLDRRGLSHEVIVSDDGSTDPTREVVARLVREGLPVVLVEASVNRGKGRAVRRGVLASAGAGVLVADADLAIPITQLDVLMAALDAGADIALGSRRLNPQGASVRPPRSREILGWTFNLLVQATLLRGIWDTQCGFKLFRGEVARRLFPHCVIDGFAYDVEVLALARRTGCAIVEVPVAWSHAGGSSVRILRDGAAMLRDMARIARRLSRFDAAAAASAQADDPA
ncbi:MAG: glycosyltransferase family 2 protein [Armatimonadota bacterium]|nr:glycosyltransferase family 2 protein [Armatimonadota bacterium]